MDITRFKVTACTCWLCCLLCSCSHK